MGVLRTLSLTVLLTACGGRIIDIDIDGGVPVVDAGGASDAGDAGTADSPSDSTAPETSCTTTSDKLCDQCMAATDACCKETTACNQDPVCAKWLSCVWQCEQAGSSALACVQGPCTAQSSLAANVWYDVQYYCPVCAKD